MELLRELLQRVKGGLRPSATDQRISEEVEFHLDMLTRKYQQQGMTARDARNKARREFGGVAQMQEQYRDQSRLPWLDILRSDISFSLRSFRKTPGLVFLVVLTLGLGVGANTAIFSFLNELLIKPLPYPDSARLVNVGRWWPGDIGATAPRDFALIRDKARSFSAVGTMFLHHGENIETPSASKHVETLQVSEGYFRALGIQPLLGRTFLPEEDIPNGPQRAVLSYKLWRSVFNEDPNILSRQLRISGRPYTIVGVMPQSFSERERADLWLPLQTTGLGNDTNYMMVARLADGVSLQQAAAEVETMLREADRQHNPDRPRRDSNPTSIVVPLQEAEANEFRKPVLLLYAGVCVVLFVACLNVANLLLSRSAARAKEIAVRTALGASRGRIMQQVLTESVLLALMGGIAGQAIGFGFAWMLSRMAPYSVLQNIALDRTTLLFTTAVSLIVGIAFGLAPAIHSLKIGLNDTLKESGGKSSAARPALRGRQFLVFSQVALCTVLLTGAGLLVRTVLNLRSVQMGFNPANVLTSPMSLNKDKLATKESLNTFYEQAMQKIREVPGVTGVAVTTQLPVEGQFNLGVQVLDTKEPQPRTSMQFRAQTKELFRVLGMTIVRGRDFADTDRPGGMLAAIVNESFARRYFRELSTSDVLGKRLLLKHRGGDDIWTIVGIVNDVREVGLRTPAPPVMYTLIDQTPQPILQVVHSFVPAKWVIGVAPGMSDVSGQIRQTVGVLDPAEPFQEFQTMESLVAKTMRTERFLMVLLGGFAMLTLVMVASGLYGTLSYGVNQRRQEIGIRMAMGAVWYNVVGMVAASGLLQVGAGLILGLVSSYWATRLMSGFLFNVPPIDIWSLAGAAATMLIVGLVAGIGPSVNAVRTNPIQTLRVE
jgi:putative ABC transport system permease protein